MHGTTTMEIARLQYMFDGVLSFASQSAGYPKLNGANPPGSGLLLAGDQLDCSFTLASQPTNVMVITEFGNVYAHSP